MILLTDNPDPERQDLLRYARENGIAELMVPREIHSVAAIPLLGSGKTDYEGVKELAANFLSGTEPSQR